MKFVKSRGLIIFICSMVIANSCQNNKDLLPVPGKECPIVPPKFNNQVQAIIQTHCAIPQCHDAGSTNLGGPFTNYRLVKNKAQTIKVQVVNRFMPQGSSLSAENIKTISCWVDSGAPEK